MMDNDFCCLNCGRSVSQSDAKLFAGVYVCASCYSCAEHFHEKLTKELKGLLVLAKESIRVALAMGSFHPPLGTSGEPPTKKAVLEAILAMEDKRNATS